MAGYDNNSISIQQKGPSDSIVVVILQMSRDQSAK